MPARRRSRHIAAHDLQLEQEIERINRFPDQNPNPVLRMTTEGVLLYANPASSPITNRLGVAVGEPLPAEFLDELRSALSRLPGSAVPGYGPEASAVVELRADHRTYAILAVPVHGFGFVNLYGTDVTGEKVVARFPDDNPHPVFRVTEDGHLLYANGASLPVVRALGAAIGEALAPEIFERLRRLADRSLGKQEAPDGESFEVRGDDARWYVLTPVWVREFEFINVYGTDVTGEKVVARFPDQNPNPVIRITGEGRLLYANEASALLQQALGWAVGQGLPRDVRDRVIGVAESESDETIEVSAGERVYVLKPVWIREFGFINIYGTDVTASRELEKAHRENERLLLNILPEPIARRLSGGERVIADRFDDVTLLFADIVGFTQISNGLSAPELVEILNRVFSEFDVLVARYGLEKIKTIGDAYMVVGGLPEAMADHTARVADMALELRDEIATMSAAAGLELHCRIGMNAGPVVAGVIGVTKFIYDVWGDTVNTASRMESHGLPDKIQVTHAVYERLRDRYAFEPRGLIDVKGKGPMLTYFLLGRTEQLGRPREETVEAVTTG